VSKPQVSGLTAVPLQNLLAKSQPNLECTYIQEPELAFSSKQRCVDPKTGLTAFGPYSRSDASRREQLRVGIVGPAVAIEKATALLVQMTQAIEQNEKVDAVLHPSFPGFNKNDPFQIEIVSQDVWKRSLRPSDIALVENNSDFMARVGLLRNFVSAEVKALSELDTPPDVVICAMTAKLEELCRKGIAEYDATREEEELDEDDDTPGDLEELKAEVGRSFRRGLKAECLNILPTQLIWNRTLAGTKGVQDLPTRAWNLAVALMYKAGIIPWRLADTIEGSCFVGISFFHEDEARSPYLRTSVAQAFSERGEGFVLRGEKFEWNPKDQLEKSPHLPEEQASQLLKQVLDVYEKQVGTYPRKVVLHKTSRYTLEERNGFEKALENVRHYALTTISRRGIFCLRPGTKPVIRGTAIHHGDNLGLIYTMGYVPFLRCYPGFRIPQPLEILENWGSIPFSETAADIMRLTKLNCNTAAFNIRDPITLAFSKKVGEILKLAGDKEPALHYRYYM
jgi:hypothetical protein